MFEYYHAENLPILTMAPDAMKQHLDHLCFGSVELSIDDDGHWGMFTLVSKISLATGKNKQRQGILSLASRASRDPGTRKWREQSNGINWQ